MVDWKEKIGFSRDVLELIYFVVLFAATAGTILGVLKQGRWAFLLIGLGIIGIIVLFGFAKWREDRKPYLNPNLLIERYEEKINVMKDRWYLIRRISFRARRKVEGYRFYFFWTGSSQNVELTCGNEDGVLIRYFHVKSIAMQNQPCELRFTKPLKRGETKTVELRYVLPDPNFSARPQRSFSFGRNVDCMEFECRLLFSEDIKIAGVYFVVGNELDIPLTRSAVAFNSETKEYVVKEKPKSGYRYAVEWEYGDTMSV